MKRPNIITIVADDLGYGDLSCMGGQDLETPHLDALAASGVLCTDFYSNSPVCSPSRASLLTGRYPGNAGIRSILKGHRTAPGLTTAIPTMPILLKKSGYATGLFGKWHLGVAPGSRPTDHGYEESFGFYSGAIDYFSHIHYGPNNRKIPDGRGGVIEGTPVHDLWHSGEEVWEDGNYFTDLVTERALDYVRRQQGSNRPFHMHLAYSAPHYPLHAPKKYKERFAHLPWERQIMAAMIYAMDSGIGRILKELDAQGIRENTFVFFMSDNGPSREMRNWLDGSQNTYHGGTTGPLRGHKFSLFEGGIRVPGIFSWPEAVPEKQVISQAIIAMDVLPTLMTTINPEVDLSSFDGSNILPVLTSGAKLPDRDLFWEQGRQTAVRRNRWKLVLNGQLVEEEGPIADSFLADLYRDPGERRNCAQEHPDLVEELSASAMGWRSRIEDVWRTHWLPQLGNLDAYTHPEFLR